jgi:hypothetical protein
MRAYLLMVFGCPAPITSFLFLRYHQHSFKIRAEILFRYEMIIIIQKRTRFPKIGVNMGEVIRFVPKSERERTRLVREARAMYDSIFPSADPVRERQDKAPIGHAVSGTKAHRSDGGLLS